MNEHASPRRDAAPAMKSSASSGGTEEQGSLFKRIRARLKVLFGQRNASIKEAIEEAIEEVLEDHGHESKGLASEETTMLRNVLGFGDITVHDIMTPRSDIMAVPVDIGLEDLKRHIIQDRHTRIPLYTGSLDHVEGFVHIKDLFAVMGGDQPYELKRVMRPMLFVSPSMKVMDLLIRMRRASSHMAVVVDEYGGTDGLVTLEDVFEELVGEIQDEHDEEEGARDLVRVGVNVYEADARVRIERLETALGLSLLTGQEEQSFDTLGGLIFFELGRVPARGEVVPHGSGLRFEILEADPRRIQRVRIVQQAMPEAA